MVTRKEILEMLSEGKIDVTRATEMLNEARAPEDTIPVPPEPPAPGTPPPPPPPPPVHAHETPAPVKAKRGTGRWLHIQVSDLSTGRSRVRVNVPLGLVKFGMKIGARFTDEVDSEMMQDVMEALQGDEISGTLVEVEDMEDNERVHIYVD